MYCHLKKTAFEMLSRTQAYSRIRSGITTALTRRACSSGDVIGRDPIRVILEPARFAAEQALRAAVASLAMLAARAGFRGIARINGNHGDAFQRTLVLKEHPQHRVRPQVVFVSRSLAAPGRAPSEVRQVLNGERVAGRERVNDIAAYNVQGVADEASFSTGEPVPQSFEPWGAFGIELASDLATFVPVRESLRLHRATREHLAGAESGYYGLPHIQAHGSPAARRLRDFGTNGDVHVPLAVLAPNQLTTLNTDEIVVGKEMPLIVANGKRDTLSTVSRGEAYSLIPHPKRKRPLIVGYGAILEAAGLLALTFRNTANSLYRKVRGEAKPFSEVVVAETVQGKPPPLVMLSRHLKRVVASVRKGRDRSLQRLRLTDRGLNLRPHRKYRGLSFHTSHFSTNSGARIFLRQINQAVSNPKASV